MRDRFYITSQIGPNRYKTPEGYLVCIGVPIARTGVQEYGPGETPVEAKNGLVLITRSPDQVFAPDTIASVNGKSLCNEHPPDDVKPKTWQKLTVGVALHPRRGEGDESELLLADLMWTDHDAIGLVEGGKVELSCGYDCDYEQTALGEGRQLNIIINHIALVDQGRCGNECSVKDSIKQRDSAPHKCGCSGGSKMADTTGKRLSRVKDAIRKAVDSKKDEDITAANDAAKKAMDEEREEGEEDGKKWTDDSLDDRFDSIKAKQDEHDAKFKTHDSEIAEMKKKVDGDDEDDEDIADKMEDEAPEGKGKDARKAKDSAFLNESYQATVSLAEIVAPGLHIVTYDAKAPRKKTLDAICGLRRKALGVAGATTDGAALITEIRGGRVLTADSLANLDCTGVRTLFLSTGAAMRKTRTSTGDNKIVIDRPEDKGSTNGAGETREDLLARKRKEMWG